MSLNVTDELLRKMEKRVIPVEEGGNFRATGLKSSKIAYEMVLEHYRNVLNAEKENKHVAWLQMASPWGIFYAFNNVVPLMFENYVYTAATIKGMSAKFLDLADNWGFSRDMCSSVRAQLGAIISGDVPKPSFFVTGAQPCDGYKIVDFVKEQLKIPVFVFDSPFYADQTSMRYHEKEVKNLISFVEDVTGDKIDYEKLDKSIDNAKKVYRYYRDINELRKSVPAPISSRDGMRTYGYTIFYSYLDKTVEYMKALKEEVEERVAQGIGYAKQERYRILWCQTAPFYVDLFKYLEEEFGAIVVFDELSQVWFDDKVNTLNPFEFMSIVLYEPWNGLGGNRVKTLIEHAKEFKVDACIHMNQWGCRISGHMGSMIKDILQKEVGIPTLLIDLDYISSADYNETQVKAKFKAFIETLKK